MDQARTRPIQRGVLNELIVRNLTMVTAESPSQVT